MFGVDGDMYLLCCKCCHNQLHKRIHAGKQVIANLIVQEYDIHQRRSKTETEAPENIAMVTRTNSNDKDRADTVS